MENNEKYVLGCLGCGEEFEFNTIEEYETFRDNNLHLFDSRGDFICEHCIDNYYQCGDCEEFVDCFNGTYIEDCDKWVCNDCLDNYSYCEECENYVSGTTYTAYHNDREVNICEDCRHNVYYECDRCRDLVHCDDLHYDDDDDNYYCDNCYCDTNDDRINRWHGTDNYEKCEKQYYKGADDSTRFYGIEVEMQHKDCNGSNIHKLLDIFDKYYLPCVYERDGSLDSESGVELISKPCPYNLIIDTIPNIRTAFTGAIELGYRSDKDCCGIHIHVSRPSDEVIDKIMLVMETFKDEIIKIARRHNTGYSAFLSDSYYGRNKETKSLYYIKKHKHNLDRYVALNITNYNTIEFRIFRGTLNVDTYLAYIEFVKNIVDLCSDKTLELKDITWDKIISGEFIRPYAVSREVVECDKVLIDNSLPYIILERNLKKTYKKIARELRTGVTNKLEKMFNDINLKVTIKNNMVEDNDSKCCELKRVIEELRFYYGIIKDLQFYSAKSNVSDFRSRYYDLTNHLYFDYRYDTHDTYNKIKVLESTIDKLYEEYNNL